MIPNNIYFVYGLKIQKSEMLFVHYLAVLSSKLINNPDNIYFYYHYEPFGKWWDNIKNIVTTIKIDIPLKWGDEPIHHYAHAADFIRMDILFKYGGVYMDIDTISINPYNKYLSHKFVIGKQTRPVGLSNAIMMSEPKTEFLKLWLDNYPDYFKSTPPGTKHWDLASIKLPYKLSESFDSKYITILDSEVFCNPNWDQCEMIFEKNNNINDKLITLHLWETSSINYLKNIHNFSWFPKNSHTLYGKIGLQLIKKYNLSDSINEHIIEKITNIHMRNFSQQEYFNKILKILDLEEDQFEIIINNNYCFFKIFEILKNKNKLMYIYPFLLYNFPKYKNLEEELKCNKLFESYLDYCIENIPSEVSQNVNHTYFKYFYKKNFFMSYTNLNNKELLKKLNLIYKSFTSIFNNNINNSICVKEKKIKLGIVSNVIFSKNNPVSRDRLNILLKLDRNIYDIFIITSIDENYKLNVLNNYPKIICNFDNYQSNILNKNFDILFYPEIGIDYFTFICGLHRLAPIQIVTWGHSETTGMESMDYYISSKYFNTQEDQKYFSEKLILLDSLGTYYSPTNISMNNNNIYSRYNLKPHQNIYNCLQTPCKTNSYQFLNILKNLLSKDSNGICILLYYTYYEKKYILDFFGEYKDQLRLFTYQTRDSYQNLMKISTILLDPYPFGSLNTALDSFVFGKIIVTMPSNKINGNFCSGFYKKMGICEPIVDSLEEYVSRSLEFSNNESLRKQIENKIIENKNILFHDNDSVIEYNSLFKNIYEKHNSHTYKKCITDENKILYIDKYNLVWNINDKKELVSEGMLFNNKVYTTNSSFMIKRIETIDNLLSYPKIVPIVETNYETKVIDTYPKGNEIITWMIAVYNRKNIVKQTIDSLLNQSDSNWKCIICDDGSTDGSYEYIKSYIGDDNRFSIYRKENSGYVQTCRFMHDKVNTDVVAILDSDDVLEPKANEILMYRYRKENCSAIYTGYTLCDNNLKVIRTVIPCITHNDLLVKNPFEHIRSWRTNCLPIGAFPKFLVSAEDQDLAYRFEEQGLENILIEKTSLVKFRQTENSLMRTPKTREEARICHYLAKIAAINRRNKFEKQIFSKIIHQTWIDNNIPEKLIFCVESWKKLNPEYNYMFWTDNDIQTFIKDKYPEYYNIFLRAPLGIQKSDIFRILVLHYYGGVYADIDFECLIPIQYWNLDFKKINLSYEPIEHHNKNILCNAIIISPKAIDKLLDIITYGEIILKKNKYEVLNTFGPIAWTKVMDKNNNINVINTEYFYPIPDITINLSLEKKYSNIIQNRKYENSYAVHYWNHSNWKRENILDKYYNFVYPKNEIKSINVCGIYRNNESYLKDYLIPKFKRLENIYPYIQFYYYFYENDSLDNTKNILYDFSLNRQCKVLSEKNNTKLFEKNLDKERIINLCKCRNKLLSLRPFKGEWTIIFDSNIEFPDNLISRFICKQLPDDLVVLSCNGKDHVKCLKHNNCYHYYDTLALIDNKNISGFNYFYMNKSQCCHLSDIQDRINWFGNKLVKVKSAFGGCIFIKTDILNNNHINYCINDGIQFIKTGKNIFCEHHGYYELFEQNQCIYIDPTMIIRMNNMYDG